MKCRGSKPTRREQHGNGYRREPEAGTRRQQAEWRSEAEQKQQRKAGTGGRGEKDDRQRRMHGPIPQPEEKPLIRPNSRSRLVSGGMSRGLILTLGNRPVP